VWNRRTPEAELLGRMTRLVDTGQLTVVIDHLSPLEQAALTLSPGGTWTRAWEGRHLDRLKLEKKTEPMKTDAQALASILGPLWGGLLYTQLGHASPYWSAAIFVALAMLVTFLALLHYG
jgi:hypothetical protein